MFRNLWGNHPCQAPLRLYLVLVQRKPEITPYTFLGRQTRGQVEQVQEI